MLSDGYRERTTSTFLVSAPHRTASDLARAALTILLPSPTRPPAAQPTPPRRIRSVHCIASCTRVVWPWRLPRAQSGSAMRTTLRSARAKLRTRDGRRLAPCEHPELVRAWHRPPHPASASPGCCGCHPSSDARAQAHAWAFNRLKATCGVRGDTCVCRDGHGGVACAHPHECRLC